MGRLGDATVNSLLDLMFGSAHAGVFPPSYEVGLSLTAPQNDGSGITEPTDPSYARASVPNDSTHFPNATARQKTLALPVVFNQPTGVWSTVTSPVRWIILYDSSGNYCAGVALSAAMVIDSTSAPPVIPAGTLVVYGPAT